MTRSILMSIVILISGTAGFAQEGSTSELLKLAEKRFAQRSWVAAEPLYREILKREKASEAQNCWERLLSIYIQFGRYQEAFQLISTRQARFASVADPEFERVANLQKGICYLGLGHYREATRLLESVLPRDRALDSLVVGERLTMVLECLARCAEKQKNPTQAKLYWERVRVEGQNLIVGDRGTLKSAEIRDISWRVADALMYFGRSADGIALLEKLLPELVTAEDFSGQRETNRRLATLLSGDGRREPALKRLEIALALQRQHFAGEKIAEGDLLAEKARILALDHSSDADRVRAEAVRVWEVALDEAKRDGIATGETVRTLWKLHSLYQMGMQFQKALQLTRSQTDQWSGSFLSDARLQSETGSGHYLLGQYLQALPALEQAVARLEKQTPVDLIELPRAYVNLATTELARNNPDRTRELVAACRTLIRRYELPETEIVVEFDSLLGGVAAQEGQFAKAVACYDRALESCERLGRSRTAAQRSQIHLNLSLLFKSQRDLKAATQWCLSAYVIWKEISPPDSVGSAIYEAALTSLYLASGKPAEAEQTATHVVELIEKNRIELPDVRITAKHTLAIAAMRKRDNAGAQKLLEEVEGLQTKFQPRLLPRTLNYLGANREAVGDPVGATAYYRRSIAALKGNEKRMPAIAFMSRWRLAGLEWDAGRRAEACETMESGFALIEASRVQVFGDARQRSDYFSQFAPGLETLVDWYVVLGRPEKAIVASARSRSRTLLDQLLLANVDPREDLPADVGPKLVREEAELQLQMNALRTKAGSLSQSPQGEKQAFEALREFETAQERYSEVWRAIMNASPAYRHLSENDPSSTSLARMRERAATRDVPMLIYHLGPDRGYAFLVSPGSTEIGVWPLRVPTEFTIRIAPPSPARQELAARTVFVEDGPAAFDEPSEALLPPVRLSGESVPLGAGVARSLVSRYRNWILRKNFDAARSLVIRRIDGKEKSPGLPSKPEDFAEIFLPKALRVAILRTKPKQLIVVPDGAMHTLPLEALVLESGASPVFALDVLPPIVYAPSLGILSLLAERPAVAADRPVDLLTLGDPTYTASAIVPVDPASRTKERSAFAAVNRLIWSGEESRRIADLFPGRSTVLVEANATEKNLREAVGGKRIVHIAAHGFADSQFGNLFGALLLTPGAGKIDTSNDGFLCLHEIYHLPLQQCEIAVLSACLTNIGPERPLEAGVTLASGFLTAGARQVVASHWEVADNSTAKLMEEFFREWKALRATTPFAAGTAMQEARKKLRQDPRFASPMHWAPFVVIGTIQ